MRKQEKQDLTKQDVEWLERHGFKLDDMASSVQDCYQRTVGREILEIYYSMTRKTVVCVCVKANMERGEGETAEEAFLDFLQKHKAHIEELQNFRNELEKIEQAIGEE